ncbi:hypothetical protein NDU88_011300 [Pleurodeles waltl]|uniref:Uncharacterized protein n=1 Tax=Pleurodeles waltl TaxID=8319 RepID=A0AAV7R2N2_PLEWA|nr:hypothetical protein NDU88_011300 [Pleurodeles waltl]
MPRGKSSKATPAGQGFPSSETVDTLPEPLSRAPLTPTYVDNFFSKLYNEIGSLNSEFRSCIHKVKQDINGLGERIKDMKQTLDSQTDDLKALSRRVATLEEQQMDPHLKHEDLENLGQRNIPKGMEGPDIMSFIAEMLPAIRTDPDNSPPLHAL